VFVGGESGLGFFLRYFISNFGSKKYLTAFRKKDSLKHVYDNQMLDLSHFVAKINISVLLCLNKKDYYCLWKKKKKIEN